MTGRSLSSLRTVFVTSKISLVGEVVQNIGGGNFSSGITRNQASLYFCGGKEHLIQLLDYLSDASPESGLFSDWSSNKTYLELSRNWFPVWQCDFRSKKSREVMNSIMTSGEAREESEFFVSFKCFFLEFCSKSSQR